MVAVRIRIATMGMRSEAVVDSRSASTIRATNAASISATFCRG
jgi:hypothetical protein